MKRKELLRYSSYIHGPPKEDLEEISRVILAELFTMAARDIMEDRNRQFHKVKRIMLVLDTDLWDQRLTLILDRDDSRKDDQ